MLPIAKAKDFRCGEKDEQIKNNEKEILKCQNTNTTGHFVVGNGNGGIEYDPYSDGFVSYGDCVSKRIFIY